MAARGVSWGDVRLLEIDPPDKIRPVLVLTRSRVVPHLNAVTVAPITRTVRGIPTEVRLGVAEGLKGDSAAQLDSLQTVHKRRLGRYLGSVDTGRKTDIRDALLFALELEV